MATTTSTDKAQALLDSGAVTLHHGTGIARIYTVIGSRGAVYTTSNATCDCPAGLNGRRCYHLDAVVLLQAAETEQAPAAATDPFASLDTFGADTDAMAQAFATPTDHAVTTATAAELLTVKPATVRRYLRSGKLTRLDGGISAASVTAYAEQRTAGRQRARDERGHFLPSTAPTRRPQPQDRAAELLDLLATTDPANAAEYAAEALNEATRLAALVDKLKEAAKPVAKLHGPGTYGPFDLELRPGTTRQDSKAITAHYAALKEPVPTFTTAPSWKSTRR